MHFSLQEKEVTATYTLMDLQGQLDRKYHVGLFFSAKPNRGNMRDAWPKSEEENLERLYIAGVSVERGVPKCSNCDRKSIVSSLERMSVLITRQSSVILPNPALKRGSRSLVLKSSVPTARRWAIVYVTVRRNARTDSHAVTASKYFSTYHPQLHLLPIQSRINDTHVHIGNPAIRLPNAPSLAPPQELSVRTAARVC